MWSPLGIGPEAEMGEEKGGEKGMEKLGIWGRDGVEEEGGGGGVVEGGVCVDASFEAPDLLQDLGLRSLWLGIGDMRPFP